MGQKGQCVKKVVGQNVRKIPKKRTEASYVSSSQFSPGPQVLQNKHGAFHTLLRKPTTIIIVAFET